MRINPAARLSSANAVEHPWLGTDQGALRVAASQACQNEAHMIWAAHMISDSVEGLI